MALAPLRVLGQVALVGGVVHASPLIGLVLRPVQVHWLVSLPVHPGGGHRRELGHGRQGQQCWTDLAWACSAGRFYHWSGASCGDLPPHLQGDHVVPLAVGQHPVPVHLPVHPVLGLILRPALVHWLVSPPVHPVGRHRRELGHGGQGQQCWTDWAWVCIAGWCYHWSGASCGEASPQQTPHPDNY